MYTCIPVWVYQSPSPLYLYRIILHSHYQFPSNLYETTFSTQLFSSFLTSALKLSTSCQQSSGRRSCSRRHRMTSLRAPSTLSGRGRTCLRDSSFLRMASISLLTVYWLVLLSSLKSALASFSCAILRASASFCCSFLSSSATRAWSWSSTILEREASVSLLDCSESTRSCDSPLGAEAFHTCEEIGFDSLEPIVSTAMAVQPMSMPGSKFPALFGAAIRGCLRLRFHPVKRRLVWRLSVAPHRRPRYYTTCHLYCNVITGNA